MHTKISEQGKLQSQSKVTKIELLHILKDFTNLFKALYFQFTLLSRCKTRGNTETRHQGKG